MAKHPNDPTLRSCPRCVRVLGNHDPKVWHKVYDMQLNGYCNSCSKLQQKERNVRKKHEARRVEIAEGMTNPATMSDEEFQYWIECGKPKHPSIFGPVLKEEVTQEYAPTKVIEEPEHLRERTPEEVAEMEEFARLMAEGADE